MSQPAPLSSAIDGAYATAFLRDHPEHIETVARWYYEWFHNSKGDFDQTLNWVKTLLGRKELPLTVIALQENEIVGVAGLWATDYKELKELTPWLAAVYVSKKHRKKGVARILLHARLDVAQRLGYKKVYMWSEPENWKIHEKLGWKKMNRQEKVFEWILDQ